MKNEFGRNTWGRKGVVQAKVECKCCEGEGKKESCGFADELLELGRGSFRWEAKFKAQAKVTLAAFRDCLELECPIEKGGFCRPTDLKPDCACEENMPDGDFLKLLGNLWLVCGERGHAIDLPSANWVDNIADFIGGALSGDLGSAFAVFTRRQSQAQRKYEREFHDVCM